MAFFKRKSCLTLTPRNGYVLGGFASQRVCHTDEGVLPVGRRKIVEPQDDERSWFM